MDPDEKRRTFEGTRRVIWNVEPVHIETQAIELDFSSSGQGRRAATSVSSAGVRLFNAIELVDVESSVAQVEVCESCGVPRCSPGGWVAFRRIGETVVWLPAWDELENDGWEASEYAPPSFLKSRGIPVFSAAAWVRLRGLKGRLPEACALPRLDSREAARLCQWSAPGRLLGEFPAVPSIRRDLLIAVAEGDLAAEAEFVDPCLRDHYERKRAVDLAPSNGPVASIEFWLDLPGAQAWRGLGRLGTQACFLLGEGFTLLKAKD